MKFTDNQVDVLSKTFQGLTVSCARCHNHKFDAISQTDDLVTAINGTPLDDKDRAQEIFGTLKWGIMCMSMYQAFAKATDRTVERAAIGRRSSETEIDLVNLLFPSV